MEIGRPRADDPEVERDEARVLGLLAAVRVHGDRIIAPDAKFPDFTSGRGRWIAATWRGAFHVPLIPLVLITARNWKTARGASRGRIRAILRYIDGRAGTPLHRDRVVRAVEAIRSIELWTVDSTKGLGLVRDVIDAIKEARPDRGGSSGRHRALSRVVRRLRAARDDVAREQRENSARRERLRESLGAIRGRMLSYAHGQSIYADETGPLLAHPLLEELGRTSDGLAPARYVPFSPDSLLNLLADAQTTGAPALDNLLLQLEGAAIRRPRKNANDAFTLDEMIASDDWSPSTAARLWVRSQIGPDLERERNVVQAVDNARRRRIVEP